LARCGVGRAESALGHEELDRPPLVGRALPRRRTLGALDQPLVVPAEGETVRKPAPEAGLGRCEAGLAEGLGEEVEALALHALDDLADDGSEGDRWPTTPPAPDGRSRLTPNSRQYQRLGLALLSNRKRRVLTTVLRYRPPLVARAVWAFVGLLHRRTARQVVAGGLRQADRGSDALLGRA
jgi:hypothetical protein